MSWQHRLLDFNSAPLSDVLVEFNRRNGVQMVIEDPELRESSLETVQAETQRLASPRPSGFPGAEPLGVLSPVLVMAKVVARRHLPSWAIEFLVRMKAKGRRRKLRIRQLLLRSGLF